MRQFPIFLLLMALISSCQNPVEVDHVLRNGIIIDGSGGKPYLADLGIRGDTIAFIGKGSGVTGLEETDLNGLAVAPGFINMLSWADEALIADGRSMSNIKQGVTLEVFGEGWSGGPLNETIKREKKENQGDIQYAVEWNGFGEFMEYLEQKGVSCNIASFVGATTVRVHELGYDDRAPSAAELDRMKALVRQAMEEGAVGLGASLIYAPAFYASTEELIELCKVIAEYDGLYISHLRSEGNAFIEAYEEMIRIMDQSGVRSEIYHLKAAGKENWYKMDQLIERVESDQKAGKQITADMYTYTAASTGLDAAMPPWVQEGGDKAWARRLRDPDIRRRVLLEMTTPTTQWESLYLAAGSADQVILVGFTEDSLRYLTGKTLAEVARLRDKSPEETAMDLIIDNNADVQCVYFLMSEDNIRKQIALPWVSFGSDAQSRAPEGVFLKSSTHPRAYGNFARLLGKYVRDEQVIPLEEAVRKLSSLPARNLRLDKRGLLQEGYYADVVVFDPDSVGDTGTYENPQQYATGVHHVFVNGKQVLNHGEHTGAFPGRFLRKSKNPT